LGLCLCGRVCLQSTKKKGRMETKKVVLLVVLVALAAVSVRASALQPKSSQGVSPVGKSGAPQGSASAVSQTQTGSADSLRARAEEVALETVRYVKALAELGVFFVMRDHVDYKGLWSRRMKVADALNATKMAGNDAVGVALNRANIDAHKSKIVEAANALNGPFVIVALRVWVKGASKTDPPPLSTSRSLSSGGEPSHSKSGLPSLLEILGSESSSRSESSSGYDFPGLKKANVFVYDASGKHLLFAAKADAKSAVPSENSGAKKQSTQTSKSQSLASAKK